jgi:hypothetical protein
MQTQDQTTHTTETIEVRPVHPTIVASCKINVNFPNAIEPDSQEGPSSNVQPPHLFEHIARTTLAERFPLLTCFAISFGLLVSALITEVECLKGSGYFWHQ